MRIRPITRDDIPSVSAITFQSFRNDEAHRWLYPNLNKYPDDLRRFQIIRLRTRLVGVGQLGFVVVTEEGDAEWNGKQEVMGYAYLLRCGEDEGAKQWRVDFWFNKLERKLLEWEAWYEAKFLDRALDPARLEMFTKSGPWKLFEKIDARWHLSIIGVAPKYQRQGIGSMLVKHAQEIATEEGIPVTLESSVMGRGMYLRNGFKIVGESTIFEAFTDVWMVWAPDGMEDKWLENIVGERASIKNNGEVTEGRTWVCG